MFCAKNEAEMTGKHLRCNVLPKTIIGNITDKYLKI